MSTSEALARSLIDLSRARQALLSVAQPALGAVLALGRLPDIRTVSLGLVAAACGYLAVFSLNDVLDVRSDVEALRAGKGEYDGFDLDTTFARHPIASGVMAYRLALGWVSALAVVSTVAAWLLNPWCVAFFAASVALEALYCALRGRTWTKTLISGVMVGVGALAGWIAVAPLDARAVAFFGFLAAWEIAGRNLANDLADLVADAAVGLRTVATAFGARVSAAAIAGGSAVTLVMLSQLAMSPVAVAGGMFAGAAVMAAPAIELIREPTPAEAARYFNRASLLPAIVFFVLIVTVLASESG